MSARIAALSWILLAGCTTAPVDASAVDVPASGGQAAWAAACEDADEWDKPGPPFRVFGDTYYVGTCGITALLVKGPDGLVLFDSGTDKGAQIVLANIRALGFDPRSVKTIFMTHEHFDHVGGMARLQNATGATVITTPPAAKVLRSGLPGTDDPQAESGHPPFPPVTGKIVEMQNERPQPAAGLSFSPLSTPGHTPGATSWRWTECEGATCRTIVYADSLNPISSDGYRFSDHPALVAALREGVAKIAGSDCDIVIAPHPVAVSLRARLAGDKPLVDRNGCKAFAAIAAERMDKRLAEEAAGG